MSLEQTLTALFESSIPRRYTLPHGLALSYDPRQHLFRAGRVDHPPSATEIHTIRQEAKQAGVSLKTTPQVREMRAADGRLWKFAEWKL